MGAKRLASELEPHVEGPNTFDELSSPLSKRKAREASIDKNALPLEAASGEDTPRDRFWTNFGLDFGRVLELEIELRWDQKWS